MDESAVSDHTLGLLEEIGKDPDVTQANMATKLGVAVGTVNWHLKRLISKGYVKVKRAERRKLRYILTPEGIALRAKLTAQYIENSMTLYRDTRSRARDLLQRVKSKGYPGVRIQGDGDIAEICRLTCLEMGIDFITGEADVKAAVVEVIGQELRLLEPKEG